MHGMQECAGNVYELCVAKYHPTEWWAFLQCQNFQGTSQIGLTDTAEKCAGIAGFEWTNDAAHKCAGDNGQGEEGVQLLQRSVRASMHLGIKCAFSANVRLSTHVLMQEELHDTSKWTASVHP